MSWHARLGLDLRREGDRCVARHEHEGPLRVLQTLYPEGDAISHNVLVHPPSGLVGGDELDVRIRVGAGAHGLVTTPGAARFYRSEGETATQRTCARVHAGGRLEWLPLEALFYSGCIAENHLRIVLDPGAEVLGWDLTALGLPHAQQPFTRGRVLQHLEIAGAWIERGVLDAGDAELLDGPLGFAGHRCLGTLFFAAGSELDRHRRETLLALANDAIAEHPGVLAGATAPNPQVVAVRVLAPVVEPAMALLKAVRRSFRPFTWDLPAIDPRSWAL